MLTDAFIEAWDINNRVNLFVLAAIPDEALYIRAEKGKAPAGHFTHVHNVRRLWLSAAAPELTVDLEKLSNDVSREQIARGLEASGAAIRELLRRSMEVDRIKGFKPTPAAFFAYMAAHEGYHRGQIELTLRQTGFPLEDKVAFGMWEWGVR